MRLVIDASVAVKWFYHLDPNETDAARALDCLKGVIRGQHDVLAPPHWQPEVVAVVARKSPSRARAVIGFLHRMPIRVIATPQIYNRAADIAGQLNHHLFDTLYQALAIEEGATLVTADQVYFGKAQGLGNMQLLAAFAPPA